MVVVVPPSLATQVAVYSDDHGLMKLLGPRGWQCNAIYGADGSGGVAIHGGGVTGQPGGPFASSSEEAIIGTESSACGGCAEEQACPLFTTAAADYERGFGVACPRVRPAEESMHQLTSGIVEFEDPPNVAGDGNPSGGPYPASGVMTYHSGNNDGSWLDTCTLPPADGALCTTALHAFVMAYGDR